ncbi:MAG: DeoR/GlpR family transcriptional regulator [Candidatus Competibacteraceae bacterium]|nr:DeoR/GlpR family transcriptional regulator [Candidatus Competibacteraceae bacterium]
MTLNQRQQMILKLVQRKGFVAIEELAESFNVTPQTIRRDINDLCEHGLLRRYHGGAGLPSSVENVAYSTRQVLHLAEKQRIARLVASHIPDQASLFINIGTTTEEVAKALRDHSGLRIITNNLNVAAQVCDNPTFEVIIAGGVVRARDRGVTGEATIDFIQQFKVDFGIIGISGIESEGTLLDFDYREVRVSQAIMASSRQVFLAADHSKFGRNALVRLGHLSQTDAVFTDRSPPDPMVKVFQRAKVRLHVAEPEA